MLSQPFTILAIASYEKGQDFLREAKAQGARVLLLTSESLKDEASWPLDALDEIFYMPDDQKVWNRQHTLYAVCHLMRTTRIDRIVPLDDFDLEMAAFLREHTRVPGLGESQTRFFRDKLAMRMQASSRGLRIPEFAPILNYDRLNSYLDNVPGPWVLKPRLMAGAIGIKKINAREELWEHLERLGDEQSFYLLERYVPGEVYHVDSVVYDGEVLFAVASKYGRPPMDVSHGGGIFTTTIVERGSSMEQRLIEKNHRVMRAMGLEYGVSHTEFIVAHEDGEVYFLETSARVGGANIANLIEAATNLNPWREWARVECATPERPYRLPELCSDYSGLLVSLAKQERPDTSAYSDPEICWRMDKKNHVGLIVRSHDLSRVHELIASYVPRVAADFHAVLPPKERPTE